MAAPLMTASTSSPARMTYLDYVLHFRKLHKLERFSAGADQLYHLLLDECNYPRWSAEPIMLPQETLLRLFSGSLNTMKKCRDELVARGVLGYQEGGKGRGDSGVYALRAAADASLLKVSKSDTLSAAKKVSEKVSDFDTKAPEKVSKSDTLIGRKVSGKVSEKVSKSDTYIYKEEDKKIEDKRPSCAPEASRPSSPLPENTPGPAEQKGGAARYAPAEPDEESVPAGSSPLADARLFAILVARAGYTGLDEHAYRLQMLATAEDKGLLMPVRRWSKWVAGYLNSEKRNNKLLLAPAPGTAGNAKGGRGLGDTRLKANTQGYTL